MKESHSEGVANRTGSESCGGPYKESLLRDADILQTCGRQYSDHRQRNVLRSPARSKTLARSSASLCVTREAPWAVISTGLATTVLIFSVRLIQLLRLLAVEGTPDRETFP